MFTPVFGHLPETKTNQNIKKKISEKAIIWNKKKTKKLKKNPPLKYTSDNIYLVNVWYFPNFRKTTFAHSISFSFFFFTLYIVCSKPLRKWRENMHCCYVHVVMFWWYNSLKLHNHRSFILFHKKFKIPCIPINGFYV